jgi:hypothetical protein
MDDYEIVKSLSPTGTARATLYLSPSKVDELFLQTVGAITEFARSSQTSGKVGLGGVFGLFGGEISKEKVLEAKTSLSPLLKAMLIDKVGRDNGQVVDLALQPAIEGKLLSYVGPGHLILMNSLLTSEETGLELNTCLVIEDNRKKQESVLRFANDNHRTIVLSFASHGKNFASIASTEHVEFGMLASYASGPIYGILCRFESKIKEVTFLSPLWIWVDQ